MTSSVLSHHSHANGNCLSVKDQIEAKNINAIFSDAIRVAKSLNIAIQKMCPFCLELVQKALSEEGGQQG